jgi:hypothetical protein
LILLVNMILGEESHVHFFRFIKKDIVSITKHN